MPFGKKLTPALAQVLSSEADLRLAGHMEDALLNPEPRAPTRKESEHKWLNSIKGQIAREMRLLGSPLNTKVRNYYIPLLRAGIDRLHCLRRAAEYDPEACEWVTELVHEAEDIELSLQETGKMP